MVMVPDLELLPRGRGRAAKSLAVEFVRDLEPADLALLASERGIKPPERKKLRDRHHSAARLLAMGKPEAEVSAITGYGLATISILKNDPTFRELLEHYRENQAAAMAEFHERATMLAISAVNELQERLEDDEKPMATPQVLEVGKFAADRAGYAPQTKTLNINVNQGLAARMEAAEKRLAAAPHVVSVTDIKDE